VKCHVYRSAVKDGLYVYVAASEDDDGIVGDTDPPGLAALPAPVRRQLGRTELAMTLELGPELELGQEDSREVVEHLAGQGFHVQMPRDIEPAVEAIAQAAFAQASSVDGRLDGKR